MSTKPSLVDSFGRLHTNMRVSVTDRCNIRCFYCMPAGHVPFLARDTLLTFDEIERVVQIAVELGVRKIRLTGGEPLVRANLPSLVSRLASIPEIEDIGLTTNGILLAEQASALYEAGLRRLNISLDALSPEVFEKITRRKGYERVLEGIERARTVGFHPIKVNAVALRGLTESQVVSFGRFARESGCQVRFIEYMPLDADATWEREQVLFASEIRQIFANDLVPLVPETVQRPEDPSHNFVFEDGIGRIGFIPSVSEPCCGSCNRFRLTADGKLRNCLFSLEETDLRSLLRDGGPDDLIRRAIQETIQSKWAGHHINLTDFVRPERAMYSIGG